MKENHFFSNGSNLNSGIFYIGRKKYFNVVISKLNGKNIYKLKNNIYMRLHNDRIDHLFE